MQETKIRWTNLSWNPWTGCRQISPGCARCYAKTLAENRRGKAFPNGFNLTFRLHKLDDPLKIKKPSKIFVNSMSDLFLEEVSEDAISKVFHTMNKAYWHQFQILTKRSERLLELSPHLKWTNNIWMGVSVENQHFTSRIEDLVKVPAAIRFVSFEPLLGPVNARPWLSKIHWAIVGGESDPTGNWRIMDLDWARFLRDDCVRSSVPFFYKQGNGFHSETDPILDGKRWEQYPDSEEVPRRVSQQNLFDS